MINMPFKDWASFIFGIIALLISVYNFVNARLAERKQWINDIDQRRKSALIILRDDEVSHLNSRRMLLNLEKELVIMGKLNDYPDIQVFLEFDNTMIEKAQYLRKNFTGLLPVDNNNLDALDKNINLFLQSKENDQIMPEIRTRDYIEDIRTNLEYKSVINSDSDK